MKIETIQLIQCENPSNFWTLEIWAYLHPCRIKTIAYQTVATNSDDLDRNYLSETGFSTYKEAYKQIDLLVTDLLSDRRILSVAANHWKHETYREDLLGR